MLGGEGVAVPRVRLEQVHSMAVESGVILAHGHLVHVLQSVVDPAAVVLARFGVPVLVLEDGVVADSMAVDFAVTPVVIPGHLVLPFESVVDSARVVLLWPTRSGLLVLALALEGEPVALAPVRLDQAPRSHFAILDRAVLVHGYLEQVYSVHAHQLVVDSAVAALMSGQLTQAHESVVDAAADDLVQGLLVHALEWLLDAAAVVLVQRQLVRLDWWIVESDAADLVQGHLLHAHQLVVYSAAVV